MDRKCVQARHPGLEEAQVPLVVHPKSSQAQGCALMTVHALNTSRPDRGGQDWRPSRPGSGGGEHRGLGAGTGGSGRRGQSGDRMGRATFP